MKTTIFLLDYNFKIKNYQSGVSLIQAEFSPKMQLKKKKIALMLPTKIGVEKMKEIVKMRCEKFLELTEKQTDFIKSRTVKIKDETFFDFKSSIDFNNLFEDAVELNNKRLKSVNIFDVYSADIKKLIGYGVQEKAAKKIISLACNNDKILEMNNALYYANEKGTPILIEKFSKTGLAMFAYSIHMRVKKNKLEVSK